MKPKNKKGFTLIELIVVIAILGILATIAVPKLFGFTEKAKVAAIVSNIKNLESTCAIYNITESSWPTNGDPINVGSYSSGFYSNSGEITSLEAGGTYYKIDYENLKPYIDAPENSDMYILQNPVGNVYYIKKSGEISHPDFVIENNVLIEYTGESKEVEIPNGVTSIDVNVFRNKELTKVTIPGSVTAIGEKAFFGRPYNTTEKGNILTEVTIQEGVESIGKLAFADNPITKLTISGSVKTIGQNAFRGNRLVTLEIPEGVEEINNDAFRNSLKLKTLVLPESLKTIGNNAFYNNNELTSVTIQEGVVMAGASFPGDNFKTAYDANGPGTYTYSDSTWTKQP